MCGGVQALRRELPIHGEVIRFPMPLQKILQEYSAVISRQSSLS
jgi:hypothetical protein